MRIYKANEVDNQRFYQVPKSLFGNSLYKGLSLEAKMGYSFLRDRMELSKKNDWVNENGEIYLLFTRESMAELLDASLSTITKIFKELVKYELIMEKRQGQGKPNILFICHVESDLVRHVKSTCQDTLNLGANDTEVNDTDNNVKDNGFVSSENKTLVFSKLEHREEINVCRKYFEEYYKYIYGVKYHKHKPSQNRHIDESLNAAFDEYYLEIDNMQDMIKAYFKVKCDHNLMHFVSEGILQNRMYEVAY